MKIDIHTLALIIGIVHIIQVLVFSFHYKVNPKISGPGWWLLWSGTEVLGFTLIILRIIPWLVPFVIIFQNIILLAGTVFIYIGVLKFFNQSVKGKAIALLFLSFVIFHFIFCFVKNDINLRTLFLDIYLTIFAILTGISLYKNRKPYMASTVIFNAVLMFVHALVFTYRSVMIIGGVTVADVFSTSVFNYVQYIDALVVGLLWTFGFIMMVNQRLTAEIMEAKTHLEKIFDTIPDAVSITRLHDGLLVNCNDGYIKISGYSKNDLKGKSSLDINIWKNPADRNEVVKKVMNNGYCENYEALFQRKNGETITGLMSAKTISLDGVPHIISVTRDISDRKIIEHELQKKNEELQKLNATKDKFSSIIAHDLINPFNSIVGFSELLVEQVNNKDLNGIEKFAVNIHQSAGRVMDLLMNLMLWSQLQTDRINFAPEKFELSKILNEIILLFTNNAEQKSITISKEFPMDLTLYADKEMISTILRNLISNAIKFTMPGGQIVVSVERKPEELIFKISDNGIGIAKEKVEKLIQFDENHTTPGTLNEKGTGLGLILCKEFIEKHNGKIWIESKTGAGSQFYFTIPNH
jgi:PAS domain S-box-containing protein